MPSLLVQLDRAARGTGIKFTDIKAGDRSAAPTPAAAPATPGGGAGGPTAPGAAPAASGPGQAAQTAGNAVNNANAASGAAAGTPGAPAGTDPSAAGQSAPGLESIPLDFEFDGSFFDLGHFFHRMKRFVRVANDKIVIRGRLMTINSFTFDTTGGFPNIKAQVSATVYLAPKAQGVDAGATPQGPDAAGGAAPQPASGTPAPATPTPTATVTPR
jgi:hypothetical protein